MRPGLCWLGATERAAGGLGGLPGGELAAVLPWLLAAKLAGACEAAVVRRRTSAPDAPARL